MMANDFDHDDPSPRRSVWDWDDVDDDDDQLNYPEKPTAARSKLLVAYDDLTPGQKSCLQRAKQYCAQQTAQFEQSRGSLSEATAQQLQMQQVMMMQEMSQRQKAYSLMCRVYVGSISFEMHEDQVRQAFLPFGPIKSLNMQWDSVTMKHKGFCFVEYALPEAAQLALVQMDGVLLGGRNLKVGRPSALPAAGPIVAQLHAEADAYNRIYMSSLPLHYEEKDIKDVFEVFGAIRSVQLGPPAPGGHHGGYGYIEFMTRRAADDAVTAMNLHDLGGQYIRVTKAQAPPVLIGGLPTSTPSATGSESGNASRVLGLVGSGNVLSRLQAANAQIVNKAQDQSIQHEEFISISGSNARLMLMQRLQRKDESNVVVLRNMVSPEDVDKELAGEVKNECGRFGRVQQVIIHQQPQNGEAIIKIFVSYTMSYEAQKAVKSLNGRFFAGRVVKAELYNREKFEANDLSL